MTDEPTTTPDTEVLEAVWREARELIGKLEGSTVQRFSVQAGEVKIEIERGAAPSGPASPLAFANAVQAAAGGALGAAGAGAAAADGAPDNRITVRAPLVGTYYEAPKPGSPPFIQVGDVVEAGQVVAIVEAMKLYNQVSAEVKGKVSEIAVTNGDWVEFDQVLIYLEPAGS